MKWILVIPLIVLAVSCAPSTPDTRIAANPAAYEKLSTEHQKMVRDGRIDTGMSPEAVQLAWGNPARRYEGQEDGDHTRRWDYAGSKPVYSYNTTFGYGYGPYYRYGRWGPRYLYSIGPDVTYVPYRKASVWFLNDKVTRWERVQ